MQKILYLMLGYPGSGKTTTAKAIKEATGATHLWADKIRHERYGRPYYSHSENLALYDHMNKLTDELLAAGNSVIFDTNFNYYADREKLRAIAKQHDAKAVVVWVKTSKHLAKKRSTKDAYLQDTRVLGDMDQADFERLSNKLEEPRDDEKTVTIDGTKVSVDYVKQQLGL
jgi:predicted kinase